MIDTKQMLLDNIMEIVDQLEDPNTDAYEWLEEQLNIEGYKLNGNKEYQGGEVMCLFGGPNIWVTTWDNTVHGSWGGDYITRNYNDAIGLDDILEEIYGA